MQSVSITNTTKGRPLYLPYRRLAAWVLPKNYALSIVIVGDKESRELNRRFRKKNTPANVLSFPLAATEGELFLNPRKAKRDAPAFGMPYKIFLAYLVIHGMLHLKGLSHGSTMEQAEKKLLKRLSA